jgi:predicted GH43/DUF377 family glycosyl hydrolase
LLLVAPLFFLPGCARYADFTLPPPDPQGPTAPFTWKEAPSPIFPRGSANAQDSGDVLNPSPIPGGLIYSGFDGKTWRTFAASTRDPNRLQWQRLGVVLSPQDWEGSYIAANGSALSKGDQLAYWYQAGTPPQIAYAETANVAKPWVRHGARVLSPGPHNAWDERGVADPYVIRRGDTFYMYFLGQDRANRQRLGVARSQDGIAWEKLRANPILELGDHGDFDEIGLGEPAVWTSGNMYWMLYTGRDRAEHRRLGLARSKDGVHWEKDKSFTPIAGASAWDSAVICDPSIDASPNATVTGNTITVYFGGGDVPRPDENIHGQIGVGFLTGRP